MSAEIRWKLAKPARFPGLVSGAREDADRTSARVLSAIALASVAAGAINIAAAATVGRGSAQNLAFFVVLGAAQLYWGAVAMVAAALALGAGIVYQGTSADRHLADSYRSVLAQGHGSFFAAAPLQSPAGTLGNVFGYQGLGPRTAVEDIARVVHAANRELQIVQGDPRPSPPWDEASEYEVRESIDGVQEALHGITPEQAHEGWCARLRADGWRYGEVKDQAAKTHPCLVPFADLPEGQRRKDVLLVAIVQALAPQAG